MLNGPICVIRSLNFESQGWNLIIEAIEGVVNGASSALWTMIKALCDWKVAKRPTNLQDKRKYGSTIWKRCRIRLAMIWNAIRKSWLPLYQGLQDLLRACRIWRSPKAAAFFRRTVKICPEYLVYHGQYGPSSRTLCQGLFYFTGTAAGSSREVLMSCHEDNVLDLCAAPGSKSTQDISIVRDGFLLSNETRPQKARSCYPMERMGEENFHGDQYGQQDSLQPACPRTFEQVLGHAPCSGEGNDKKHEVALINGQYPISCCAQPGRRISLKQAWQSLKPKAGQLVY